jgi:hypothetical protein
VRRRIGIYAALKLCDTYNVSLHWVYRCLDDIMATALADGLQAVADADPVEVSEGRERDWLDLSQVKKGV